MSRNAGAGKRYERMLMAPFFPGRGAAKDRWPLGEPKLNIMSDEDRTRIERELSQGGEQPADRRGDE